MKNYEKYAEKIRKYGGEAFCNGFVLPYILKQNTCGGIDCEQCRMLQMIWLMEEYEEPETDWSQVEVDAPILVKYTESAKWKKRHFAKYENGLVYAWNNGETSWTTVAMTDWKYAKLAEDEKEPEIDWSKVEVDTPILVKFKEDKEWKKRHFAKYENGGVYAWKNSHSSWTSLHNDDVTFWSYAKLAEDEKECKDPEVDWNKVKVDTPILVRVFEGERWKKRYFAKIEDGFVYAWTGENTSLTAHGMTRWSYAKLAESEDNQK